VSEIDQIESILHGKVSQGTPFEPSDVWLNECFVSSQKSADVEAESVVDEQGRLGVVGRILVPRYPKEIQVVAIDSTSFTLGQIPDGVVGAIRVSVVVKPANESRRRLDRFGPYIVKVTEQEKDSFYQQLYQATYGIETRSSAPDLLETLDQSRSLFERFIQQKTIKDYKDSLILLDGSLTAAAVVKPSSFVTRLAENAAQNGNSIVAISKTTKLVLEQSRRNILSLLDSVRGPCCVGGLKRYIKQNQDRYLGQIYVARFTPFGEPFRVDLPENTPSPHDEVLNHVSGLAGDWGYPDELRLAHMTCILSAIEILELQSAAIGLHKLTMKEEPRARLFPL
jgi:hypothetical protein